jgi:hypothetical protein
MIPIGRIGTRSLMCALACLEPLPANAHFSLSDPGSGHQRWWRDHRKRNRHSHNPQTVGFLAVSVFDGGGNPDIATKAKANPRQVVLTERMRKQFPIFIRMMLGGTETK